MGACLSLKPLLYRNYNNYNNYNDYNNYDNCNNSSNSVCCLRNFRGSKPDQKQIARSSNIGQTYN